MKQFFYHTRNILGPYFILSPLLGFLFWDMTTVSWLPLLAGAFLGCLIFPECPEKLSLRGRFTICITCVLTWVTLSSLPFATAAFSSILLNLLFGACLGPLLLVFPSLMTIGWFPHSKVYLLGTLWFITLTTAVFWNVFLTALPIFGLTCLWLSIMVGFHIFSQFPPIPFHTEKGPLTRPPSYTAKSYLFILPAVSAPFLCLTIFNGTISESSPYLALLSIPLLIAPVLFSYSIDTKGIFSSCILLLFLQESALLCLSLISQPVMPYLGLAMAGAGFSAIPVVLPILTVYLHGYHSFIIHLSRLTAAIPLGVFLALWHIKVDPHSPVQSETPAILFLILLAAGFMCIFFVWKRRFIILKNETL